METAHKNNLKPGGYREIWQIAYPLIITNSSHSVMMFFDRKFLSMNSTEDIAAALPGGIICFTFITFFLVTTSFTSTLVSQHYGRGDRDSCARVPWAGFFFALVSGIITSLLLVHAGTLLISRGGHAPEITAREMDYFQMLMPGTGFTFITVAFCSFFSGRGKTWTVAAIHFIICLINIILDYLLIFGEYGFPKMGIAGAGLATSISSVLGAGIALCVFLAAKQEEYPTRASFSLNMSDIKKLALFGMPMGGQVLFSVAAFSYIIFLIGKLGQAQMAATTIALSINMLTFLPLLGLSEATGIVVGQYIGRSRREISEQAVYRSFRLAVCYLGIVLCIYLLFPRELYMFFSPRKINGIPFEKILLFSPVMLLCAGLHNLGSAVRFVFLGAMRGAGDTKVPMWIIIACAWGILAPGGYAIVNIFNMGLLELWSFILVYSFSVGFFLFLRFRSGAWKSIELIEQPVPQEDIALESLKPDSEAPMP